MNKYIVIVFLFFVTLGVAQNDISYFKLDSSIVYVDNSKNTYFTVTFPADSIKSAGMENAYLIGGDIFQFLKRDYDKTIYNNKSKIEKELQVLKAAMKYEVDYLEGEVFNQDIDVLEEVFLNNSGKRFHLWSYKIPESAFKDVEVNNEIQQKVSNYYFLNCIVNDFVSSIMTVSYGGEDVEQKIEFIKEISDSYNVFGGPIDIDGTYAKMDAEEENTNIEFVNDNAGFEVEIPSWANLLKSDLSVSLVLTMPDVDNVKNAVNLSWFEKDNYKSFNHFNKELILDKKTGDKLGGGIFLLKKELDITDNLNGIAYKIQAKYGNSLYDCQYVTFETKTHFVLIKFVATNQTYDLNVKKFNDFISSIKILN
ncbi:hypothetical protein FBALC1_14177 [Flavobacteriales bacterium ALC-1]|nr:hypothetical protein FBALC1_14177 [Flavobacteriales bacterium ALC-1]